MARGKLINHIPNTITCFNLFSGCVSIIYSEQQKYDLALYAIIIGAVFDFLDGFAARLLKAHSAIGKELDSLGDDITFGAAPAFIVYNLLKEFNYPTYMNFISPLIPFFAFIIAAFSAIRLAKFNIDTRQELGFIGMPTPANALFWGALAMGWHDVIVANFSYCWLLGILGLIGLTSWLLVCEIPMFSLKFKKLSKKSLEENQFKFVFVGISLMLIFALGMKAFAPIITLYVILSVILAYFK